MDRYASSSLGMTLLRAWTPVVLMVVLLVLAATNGARVTPHLEHSGGRSAVWKESWSRRYPGCVSTVLWPAREQPVALLTRGRHGTVHRVPLDRLRPSAAHRAIGACR